MTSSAEDIFTELWDSYKLGAMEMMMGNREYFVCDIDCRFSLHPKMNGEDYKPLLTQSVIDDAISKNEFRANREYFNKFDVAGGQDALVKKTTLVKCSDGYVPIFSHQDGKKYIIIYDPASKLDNSIILVAEIFKDDNKGWMARLINCKNLIEVLPGGEKKIIQKPDQIDILKKAILDYNGPALDYDNIERIIIDAGAGGGGFDISQFLLGGWNDIMNKRHVGIIDKKDKYCQEVASRFPDAKDILTLANFAKDKANMYQNASDALNQGLIIFPKDSNGRGEMELLRVNADGDYEIVYEKLNKEEYQAIIEIEMLKMELMSIEKNKNSATNRISFDTIPSKKNEGVKDDRADCCAMLCDYLMKLRAKDRLSMGTQKQRDYSQLLKNKKQVANNPFGGANPFAQMGNNPFLN